MGKHTTHWSFKPRQQAHIALHPPSPASNGATLTSERCKALASELADMQAKIGAAVEALNALGNAGGEAYAPMRLRSDVQVAFAGQAGL